MTDPRQLRPSELCRILNSTPLGEVISERQLYRHRTRAGLRIGDGRHVDLLRYVAWLVSQRHATPDNTSSSDGSADDDRNDAISATVELAYNRYLSMQQQGTTNTSADERLGQRHLTLITALITEKTVTKAVSKAGVSRSSYYRWKMNPTFITVHQLAVEEIYSESRTKLKAATGLASDVLIAVATGGKHDRDRVRAALAILDRSERDRSLTRPSAVGTNKFGLSQLVEQLSQLLKEVDESNLSVPERARLTSGLSKVTLHAITMYEVEQRVAAVEATLQIRKQEKKP